MNREQQQAARPGTPTPEEVPTIRADRDLFALAVALRRVAPMETMDPAFRETLRATLLGAGPAAVRYAALQTPVALIWVAYAGDLVKLISAGEEADFVAKVRALYDVTPTRDDQLSSRLAERARAAIAGRNRFNGAVDLSRLTPFQRSVLERVRHIPRGQVRSYAWVAREIGHPAAVRAVGTALASNPVPFLIPCHRVVRSDGDLGAYSGGGTDTKQRLLEYEGVDLTGLRDLARKGLRYRGSRNTKIFCLPTCHTGKHMHEENAVYFHSDDEAFAAGYRPCKVCRPAVAV